MRSSNTEPNPPTTATSTTLGVAVLILFFSVGLSAERLALINGTVLDPVAETETVEVLILENGVIVERLPALPDGFSGEVLDLESKFIAPGLSDLHVHSYGNAGPRGEVEVFGIEGTAERMLSVGVTGFLDLSSFEEEALELRDLQRADSEAVVGSDFYTAGAAFTCPDGHGTQFPNPAHEVENPQQARAEVSRLAVLKPDVIKLIYLASHETLPSIDRATMEAIIDEAHQHGIQVVAHTSYWPDAMEAVTAGVDAITHTDHDPVPQPLVDLMVKEGTASIPTLAVHLDLSHFLDKPGELEGPLYTRTSLDELRETYNDRTTPLPERMARWREAQIEDRQGFLDAVAQLHRAGVTLLTGSDAGNPGTFQGPSVHRELKLLVEAGLSPWAALRASSTNASKLLSQSIGMASGDLANLIVFDASPIEDIGNTATVSLVIHRGRVVDMDRLDLPGEPAKFTSASKTAASRSRSEVSTAEDVATADESGDMGADESDTDESDTDEVPGEVLGEGADDLNLLVRGEVAAPSGYRLSHVEVGLRAAGQTTAFLSVRTDADGRFAIAGVLPLVENGTDALELVAAYAGFDPVIERFFVADLPVTVDLTMRVSRFQEAIVVEALSPTDESLQPQQEFGFLDIVATAGANADPMFATQTLPGVIKLDEGSGLFVRGGDTSEVATYLDRALLDHPYRNETPTGGFFGSVDAFELEGLSLSAGGFPARYGNSLSAVLELSTRPPNSVRSLTVTVGLGAVSASLESPVGQTGSVRLATNRRDARALVDLNDSQLDFRKPPSGTDLSGRVVMQPNDRHTVSLSAYDQTSSLGTELENGNFAGLIDSGDEDRVAVLAWNGVAKGPDGREGLGPASFSLALSSGDHSSEVEIGVLNIHTGDRTRRARLDVEKPIPTWLLRGGSVVEEIEHRSLGTLPTVGGDFSGDQGLRLWNIAVPRRRVGAYVEAERSVGRRVALNVGIRHDSWSAPDSTAWDPRVSLSLRAGSESHFRVAWGRYHQAPAIEYLSQGIDFGALGIAVAEHRVVSWQLHTAGDPWQIRIEAYDKRYDDLPMEVNESGPPVYASTGNGFARGVDMFLGFQTSDTSPGLRSGWRGFAAYTYLEAERLYTPWQDNGRYETPTQAFKPDFAIPNTIQLVAHKAMPWGVSASLGFRFATGRPTTPVIGTEATEFGLTPIYAEINSDRLPGFRRVDLSASRPFAVGNGTSLLAFVGINDVFDRRNAFRYVYSADWRERRVARTAFGRTIYFGVSLRR